MEVIGAAAGPIHGLPCARARARACDCAHLPKYLGVLVGAGVGDGAGAGAWRPIGLGTLMAMLRALQ